MYALNDAKVLTKLRKIFCSILFCGPITFRPGYYDPFHFSKAFKQEMGDNAQGVSEAVSTGRDRRYRPVRIDRLHRPMAITSTDRPPVALLSKETTLSLVRRGGYPYQGDDPLPGKERRLSLLRRR
jgi:hypothetical protein